MKNLNKLANELRKLKKEESRALANVTELEQKLAEAKARVLTIQRGYGDTFNELMLEATAEEEETVEVVIESEGGLSAKGKDVTPKPPMPEEIVEALAVIEKKESK